MRVTKKRGRDLLGTVWLFERCTHRELDTLQGAATEMEFPAGKELTKQGESAALHGDRGGRSERDP